MTPLERIKELEETVCTCNVHECKDVRFLLKAFHVMREIAIADHLDHLEHLLGEKVYRSDYERGIDRRFDELM